MNKEEVMKAILDDDYKKLCKYIGKDYKEEDFRLIGRYEHDARYAYPARMSAVRKAIKKVIKEDK